MNNISLFLGVSPDLYASSSGAAFALAAAPFGSLGAEVHALRDALVPVDKAAAARFSGQLDGYRANLGDMNLDKLRGNQREMAWIVRDLPPERWERVLETLQKQDWPLRGGFLATPPHERAWEGSLQGLSNLLKADSRLSPILGLVEPPLRSLMASLMEGALALRAGDMEAANAIGRREMEEQEIILSIFGNSKVLDNDFGLLYSFYFLFSYTDHLFDALFNRSRMFGKTSPGHLERWIQIRQMEVMALKALGKHSEVAEMEHTLGELQVLLADQNIVMLEYMGIWPSWF